MNDNNVKRDQWRDWEYCFKVPVLPINYCLKGNLVVNVVNSRGTTRNNL